MTTRGIAAILLALAALLLCKIPASADPPEYRMAWVFGYDSEFANPAATSTVINRLADNNFNVVIPEIRIVAGCYYDSDIEDWADDVEEGYDPLADLIAKAHARGMECWAWILTYRVAMNSTLDDWATYTNTGTQSTQLLDPGCPGTQDYVCKIVKEIVSKYPELDGFNFDYVRYDGNQYGYNPIAKERFRSEYGYYPPTSTTHANWPVWAAWKRRQVTDLVRKCYVEATHINPQIKMTVDSIGWMGANPSTNFEGTRAYSEVCQDHKGWMQEGIVDVNVLMNYKRDWCTATEPSWTYGGKTYTGGDQQGDHRLWSNWLKSMQTSTGRHTIDGIGGYMNVMSGILTQWQYSRANGIGLGVFRYGFTIGLEDPLHPGKPVFNTNTTTVTHGSETLFYSTVKANMFQNPAPVPAMPWKESPTTGIIFGTVTDAALNDPVYQSWICKATVTLTGPVTRSMPTDATGTYGFLNLPPGTYTVTVSKAGYPNRAYTGQILAAGQALRRDVDLGFLPCVSPSETKLAADNTKIALVGSVVSASFTDYFYIEAQDRSCGIRVEKSSHGRSPGQGVDVSGIVKTNSDGERYIEASTLSPAGGGTIRALEMVGRSIGGGAGGGQPGVIGGIGLNNIGLLISTAGKVTHSESGFFYVDDGSGRLDNSGFAGVKVLPCGLSVPPVNSRVVVAGVSSCFRDGTDLHPQIRATAITPY